MTNPEQSAMIGLNSEQDSSNMVIKEDITPVATIGGQKTVTNKRHEQQLKLISTDQQAKDQIPPPMHS